MLDDLKIAIVCDWLTTFAGAEKVIEQMHLLFPNAPIYTSLYDKKKCKAFKNAQVFESQLSKIPFARKHHRFFLPWMPNAFENMDFSEFDIVLSSSHAAAKGIITKPETLHVSYCHSPMRYIWDHSHSYKKQFKQFSPLKRIYSPILHKIRIWDRIAADRVDHFIANSHYIQKRIEKYYGRESEVIHPPVNLHEFKLQKNKKDHYLAVGRLIPYKRFDLAVKACIKLNKKLKIIGEGPELKALQKYAGEYVEFLGHVSKEELIENYQNAKALIFPQREDFGIVPLEAMASGTPVIAFEAGGAMETVNAKTGIFFKEQSIESLCGAIERFEKKSWKHNEIAKEMKAFTQAKFRSKLKHSIEEAWKAHQQMLSS